MKSIIQWTTNLVKLCLKLLLTQINVVVDTLGEAYVQSRFKKIGLNIVKVKNISTLKKPQPFSETFWNSRTKNKNVSKSSKHFEQNSWIQYIPLKSQNKKNIYKLLIATFKSVK
jgi:hypothetical protein